MSHRGADDLSRAIDSWLGDGGSPQTFLNDVLAPLREAFPDVADEVSRERVRRRLATFDPRTRSPQQLLVERALDGVERVGRGVTGDEYVPWPTLVGAATVVVVAVVALAYLRRRGVEEAIPA